MNTRTNEMEATPMLTTDAFAAAITDLGLKTSPSKLPEMGQRRDGGMSGMLRSVRRAIAQAADERVAEWLPRLRAYPY
jgi:hypothetical protein